MLDGIGEVEGRTVEAGFRQGAVEELARGADEGPALEILPVARLLADQHHRRSPRAFAKHGLGRGLP